MLCAWSDISDRSAVFVFVFSFWFVVVFVFVIVFVFVFAALHWVGPNVLGWTFPIGELVHKGERSDYWRHRMVVAQATIVYLKWLFVFVLYLYLYLCLYFFRVIIGGIP